MLFMKQYNVLVDFRDIGYNVKGNIFKCLYEIYKKRNSGARFELSTQPSQGGVM